MLLASLTATSLPRQLRADACSDLADKAEKYIETCNETVSKYRVLTTEQDKLIVKLTEQRNELATATPGLPFYFWLIIGAGSYAVLNNLRR